MREEEMVHPTFLVIADRIIVALLGWSLHSALLFVITVIVLTIAGLLVGKVSFLKKIFLS